MDNQNNEPFFMKLITIADWAFNHRSFSIAISAVAIMVIVFLSYVALCVYVSMITYFPVGIIMFLIVPFLYLRWTYIKEMNENED